VKDDKPTLPPAIVSAAAAGTEVPDHLASEIGRRWQERLRTASFRRASKRIGQAAERDLALRVPGFRTKSDLTRWLEEKSGLIKIPKGYYTALFDSTESAVVALVAASLVSCGVGSAIGEFVDETLGNVVTLALIGTVLFWPFVYGAAIRPLLWTWIPGLKRRRIATLQLRDRVDLECSSAAKSFAGDPRFVLRFFQEDVGPVIQGWRSEIEAKAASAEQQLAHIQGLEREKSALKSRASQRAIGAEIDEKRRKHEDAMADAERLRGVCRKFTESIEARLGVLREGVSEDERIRMLHRELGESDRLAKEIETDLRRIYSEMRQAADDLVSIVHEHETRRLANEEVRELATLSGQAPIEALDDEE